MNKRLTKNIEKKVNFVGFIGFWTPSVVLTFIGLGCSIVGISELFRDNTDYNFVMLCLVLAGICDMFDGTVARQFNNRSDAEKKFGIELDSLVDVVSFGVFPICILLSLGINLLILIFFGVCGVQRLGFFNVMANDSKAFKGFRGVPITTSSFALPAYYIYAQHLPIHMFIPVTNIFALIIAVAFIVDIKIAKPKGKKIIPFAVLGILITLYYINAVLH